MHSFARKVGVCDIADPSTPQRIKLLILLKTHLRTFSRHPRSAYRNSSSTTDDYNQAALQLLRDESSACKSRKETPEITLLSATLTKLSSEMKPTMKKREEGEKGEKRKGKKRLRRKAEGGSRHK